MADEWMTMKGELSRKALDTLAGGIARANDGKLSPAALILMANTIYDCVSGLVDKDVLDAIYEVRQAAMKELKSCRS